jgi:hypothetical protein
VVGKDWEGDAPQRDGSAAFNPRVRGSIPRGPTILSCGTPPWDSGQWFGEAMVWST